MQKEDNERLRAFEAKDTQNFIPSRKKALIFSPFFAVGMSFVRIGNFNHTWNVAPWNVINY